MRLLLSAYACEPDRGSEPEVGLRAMLSAAEEHDVWVLTRRNNLASLEGFLQGDPRSSRIHLVGFDLDHGALAVKRRTGYLGLHWYYDRWQAAVADRAAELDREIGFDLVHHVTFATYWARVGVASVPKPLVWGPVGGGADTPASLVLELGVAGLAREAVRLVGRAVAERRPHIRSVMAGASVVVAQNPETAARIRSAKQVDIFSNGAAAGIAGSRTAMRDGSRVLFVGRLEPVKAVGLAIRTMRYVQNSAARLEIYGSGSDASRARRLIRRWNLEPRVRMVPAVPRHELLNQLAGAGVLLHPSLHDQAPLAVAEAFALGTPVVYLDRGGPPVLASLWEDSPSAAVPPGSPANTARRMAEAIDAYLATPAPVPAGVLSPRPTFAATILQAYERAVALGRPDD